jgi:hypothetical protein
MDATASFQLITSPKTSAIMAIQYDRASLQQVTTCCFLFYAYMTASRQAHVLIDDPKMNLC